MNTRQTNRLEMYLAVQRFLTEFLNSTTATRRFPALAGELAGLIARTDKIKAHLTTQSIPLAAPIEARDVALATATRLALELAGTLFAYACKNGLTELEIETKLPPSRFKRMRVAQRMYLAQRLHDLAAPLQAPLAELGFAATALADFQAAIAAAQTAVGDRVAASADKKVAFEQLVPLLAETDRHIRVIDGLLLRLRSIDHETHTRYLAARTIFKRPGARSRTDDATTAPATLTAPPTTSPVVPAAAEKIAA